MESELHLDVTDLIISFHPSRPVAEANAQENACFPRRKSTCTIRGYDQAIRPEYSDLPYVSSSAAVVLHVMTVSLHSYLHIPNPIHWIKPSPARKTVQLA